MKPTSIHILSFIVLLSCYFSSCSSDDSDIEQEWGDKILFEALDGSRASVTTSIDAFAVYGDMKLSDNNAVTPSVIFNSTEVRHNGNAWSYQGAQYWIPRHEYSFVAINPIPAPEAAEAPTYADSRLTFTYTLPTSTGNLVNNDQVTDIIAATHRRRYSGSDGNNVITFRFLHLFSRINFSIELNDAALSNSDCFKIKRIEMSGFNTSSTISIGAAQIQSTDRTDDSDINIVTSKDYKGQLAIDFDQPIAVINQAAAVRMFDGNEAIIMLPQTIDANTEVKIGLTYSVNDAEETTQVWASISDFTWESSKSYTYKFKLESDNVILTVNDAEIADWELVSQKVTDAR